jgi:DNA-binding transcriptional regulator YiaG
MPNLTTVLKSEISRLARKEIRQEIEPLKRSLTNARSEIAALKKKTRELEQELKSARRSNRKAPDQETDLGASKFRFRASSMKAHRAKLGLSAKDYGLLVGASMLSIYKWEDGKVAPRPKNLPRISEILRMGKREAQRKLAELQGA